MVVIGGFTGRDFCRYVSSENRQPDVCSADVQPSVGLIENDRSSHEIVFYSEK